MIFSSSHVCLVLLHSLWQMALLAGVVELVGRLRRRQSVESRYAMHVAALVLGVAMLPMTYAYVQLSPSATAVPIATVPFAATPPYQPYSALSDSVPLIESTDPGGSSAATSPSPALPTVDPQVASELINWSRFTPWLVGLYVAGVVLMLVRLLTGIVQSQRLGSGAKPITDGPLRETLQKLSKQWSLRAVPALAYAERVVVPKVVGLIQPTILLPASALTGLTASELEMILAHELAHVCRHDMGVHLFQRLAEAVLFFNPALWYLSRRISTLREYCCDEMTCRAMTESTADDPKLRYATALLRVVELAGPKGATGSDLAALAASGRSPSELRRRVARLFGEPLREPVRLSRGGVLLLAVMGLILAIGPVVHSSATPSVEKAETETELEKPIVLEGNFADQVEAIVSEPFSKHPFSFMTPEEQEEIGPAFGKVVVQFIATHAIDLEAVPVERRVAILSSLRKKVNHYCGYSEDTAESRNRIYLGLPGQLKTYQWQVFMALSRGELSRESLDRQEKQREWMRDVMRKLPKCRGYTLAGEIAELDRQFSDPLNSSFDQPMSDEQFSDFQKEIIEFVENRLARDGRSDSPSRNPLPFLAHHFLWDAIQSLWIGPSSFPVFDDDKISGFGAGGSSLSLFFTSNRQHKGIGGSLETFDTRPVAIDAITGLSVSLADRNLRPQEALRRRQVEGKGDFAYDDRGLFAVHDAKLLRLAVNDWPSAEKISNEALRVKLKISGVDLIPLNDALEASLSRYDSIPVKPFDGVFIGVLTIEGKLSVVHIQDIYKGNIDVRTRPRSETAKASPATISGKIVLEDGSPATTTGWLHYDSRKNRSSFGGTVDEFVDRFSCKVPSGKVWLWYFAEGFAPAIVGPYDLAPGENKEVTITLDAGYRVPLRVVDAEGNPVPEARISASPVVEGDSMGSPSSDRMVFDDQGNYLLENVADVEYSIRVEAPGFEQLYIASQKMHPNKVSTLRMIQSQPASGVVFNADGSPAAFAKLFLKRTVVEINAHHSRSLSGASPYGDLAATTDAEGRFVLNQLARGAHYVFVIEAADEARLVVYDIKAGLQDIRIAVPKRRDLYVKITGGHSEQGKFHGSPTAYISQSIEFNTKHDSSFSFPLKRNTPIELTGIGGTAIYRGLPVDPTTKGSKQQVNVSINADVEGKIVDLKPEGVTHVEFVLPAEKSTDR